MALPREEAIDFLSQIPCINYGGCGVAAYAFYMNEFRAKRSRNLQIAVIHENGEDGFEWNAKAIEHLSPELADAATHVAWTFDKEETLHDCNGDVDVGLYDEPEVLVIPKKITQKFLLHSLNQGTWNIIFDREQFVPEIFEKFELNIKNVQNFLHYGEY